MDTLKIIIFSICVLVVTYAIAKKNRIFFNYGYLIVAIMIIINDLLLFASGYELINLALAGLFLIQAILVIPNKLPPLTKKGSVIARTAVPKIMFSLTIINFFSAYYVTQVDYIPHAAMYGHLIMGVFPIFPAYFLLTGKIEIVD